MRFSPSPPWSLGGPLTSFFGVFFVPMLGGLIFDLMFLAKSYADLGTLPLRPGIKEASAKKGLIKL